MQKNLKIQFFALGGMALAFLLSACVRLPPTVHQLAGPAQGTSYSITYYGQQAKDYRLEIDSIFTEIDRSLSTYNPESTVSHFNRVDTLISDDPHFYQVFSACQPVYRQSAGAFDPTIMPLVRAWGFGPDNALVPKTDNLDSLVSLVGLEKILVDEDPVPGSKYRIRKTIPGLELDFNAIAPGYTVDVIAEFLEAHRVRNYLIELGGEVRAKGENPEGDPWQVGIVKPTEIEGLKELSAVIKLDDQSLATSGNYNKYYIRDGVKYSHTIDPFTASPVAHSLLSVTVVGDNAAKCDAYATVFMVLGRRKARQLIDTHPELNLEAFFIYSDQKGRMQTESTKGMADLL